MYLVDSLQLVIVSSSASAPGAVKLRDTAEQLGYEAKIAVLGTDDIVAEIQNADKVIYRVGPKTYATYLSMLPRISRAHQDLLRNILVSFDKAQTSEMLSAHSIPSPATQVLNSGELPDNYPVVVKILRGNQGLGVELVRSVDEYRKFAVEYADEGQFIVQEYIAEADKQDKRLFIVGEHCVAAMRRRSQGDDFRANLHMGGKAEPYVPTNEEVAMAVRASKAFDLPFAGIDIIDSDRGPLVLEVNPSPGLAIGEVTGIDVASKIIKGVM